VYQGWHQTELHCQQAADGASSLSAARLESETGAQRGAGTSDCVAQLIAKQQQQHCHDAGLMMLSVYIGRDRRMKTERVYQLQSWFTINNYLINYRLN